jgi:hypothetical protein
MDKQKVDGKVWVYDTPHGTTVFYTHTMDGQPGYVYRGQVDVTVEVDAISKDQAIQALRNSAEDVNAEATATVRDIMQQIKDIEGGGDE